MPRDLKEKELLARYTINVNRTMLREFANLIERLSFESSKIIALKKHSHARDARNSLENSKPLLVTNGVEMKKKRRCELSSVKEYLEDNEFLFINHLHDVDEKQDESITSFFVRKFIYSAFFKKSSPLPLKGLHSRNNAVEGRQTLKRQELKRQEQERQERRELERQEQERQGLERQDLERQDLERRELERQEQERQELERQELERQELERQELERRELERREQERQEQERQDLERQDLERQEQERQDLERQELERRELKRQELERREQERQELKRQKLEKQRQERRD